MGKNTTTTNANIHVYLRTDRHACLMHSGHTQTYECKNRHKCWNVCFINTFLTCVAKSLIFNSVYLLQSSRSQTVVKLTVVPCPPVVEVLIKRPDVKYQLGFSVQNGVVCSSILLFLCMSATFLLHFLCMSSVFLLRFLFIWITLNITFLYVNHFDCSLLWYTKTKGHHVLTPFKFHFNYSSWWCDFQVIAAVKTMWLLCPATYF